MGNRTYECLSCKTRVTISDSRDISASRCCKIPNYTLLSMDEGSELIVLLKNRDLFKLITETELDKQIVGEVESRKAIFLSACGRLVKNCQTASYNLLINDEAGAGKDYVVQKTLDIIPRNSYIHKTRISPAVFTYWHNKESEPSWTWDGKVFYPEDISEVVLNSDVFKVMCSSGSSATVVIRQKAVDLEIVGKPVMITTTATATPNPELTRRFMILNLDGSEEQTKAIMKRHSQMKKLGNSGEYDSKFIRAQELLERVAVKIPFSDLIDQHFPTQNIIMRTLYPRFLDYVCASAAFHQYQRKKDEMSFVLAEGQDYDLAREVFLKLTSNKYMIPLTKSQKLILEIFEKEPKLKVSASQAVPLMKGEIKTVATMQIQLNNLLKYGLLESSIQKDSLNRDLEVFSISKSFKPNEKIDIPTYEEICRNTKITEIIKTSIPSETSIITNEEQADISDISVISVINAPICNVCQDKGAITDGESWFCEKHAFEVQE